MHEIILVIDEIGMLACGFAPGGTTGIQNKDLPSLENARVPSCFLYAAEPLSDAIFLP